MTDANKIEPGKLAPLWDYNDVLSVKFPVITVEGPGGTSAAASALAGEVYGGLVIILSGGLGAGKTALTKSLAEALGVSGVKSPTFATESVHRIPGRDFSLIHADLYRFEAVPPGSETGMALDEHLCGPSKPLMIVEWGDRWTLPPADRWEINISFLDGLGDRAFAMSAYGEAAAEHMSRAYEAILGALPGRRAKC